MNEYFAELCEDPEYVKPNLLIIAADIEVPEITEIQVYGILTLRNLKKAAILVHIRYHSGFRKNMQKYSALSFIISGTVLYKISYVACTVEKS